MNIKEPEIKMKGLFDGFKKRREEKRREEERKQREKEHAEWLKKYESKKEADKKKYAEFYSDSKIKKILDDLVKIWNELHRKMLYVGEQECKTLPKYLYITYPYFEDTGNGQYNEVKAYYDDKYGVITNDATSGPLFDINKNNDELCVSFIVSYKESYAEKVNTTDLGNFNDPDESHYQYTDEYFEKDPNGKKIRGQMDQLIWKCGAGKLKADKWDIEELDEDWDVEGDNFDGNWINIENITRYFQFSKTFKI